MANLLDSLRFHLGQLPKSTRDDYRRVVLKEVIQAHVLGFVYGHAAYRTMPFYGGTCLRTIYGLDRLSEDLDFDNQDQVDLDTFAAELTDFMRTKYNYTELVIHEQKSQKYSLRRFTLRLPILHTLELSPLPSENLHVKLEFSSNTQHRDVMNTATFKFGQSLAITHHTLSTLMAGKIMACLERNYTKGTTGIQIKGRDFYDLIWYMQRQVLPLEAKLAHDGNESYTIRSAFEKLKQKIQTIKPQDIFLDLAPLVEETGYAEQWCAHFHENFTRFSEPYLSGEIQQHHITKLPPYLWH